jgi:putative NADH-flavin reductase
MRLVVFGSTGGTGAEVVRQAAAAGHVVTAVARNPGSVAHAIPGVNVVRADVTETSSVEPVLHGCDAVVSALGARSLNEPTTVYSNGMANILNAMRRADVRRVISISAAPVGRDSQNIGLMERFVLFPMLYRFFGRAYDDMKRMEVVVERSDRDWTIFRPPQLVDRPAKGRYRTAIDVPLPRAMRISRADLAAAMLASISDVAHVRHIVTIGY